MAFQLDGGRRSWIKGSVAGLISPGNHDLAMSFDAGWGLVEALGG